MATGSNFENITGTETDSDSTESFSIASDESLQIISSSCSEDSEENILLQSVANKKRKKKSSSKKKQKNKKRLSRNALKKKY